MFIFVGQKGSCLWNKEPFYEILFLVDKMFWFVDKVFLFAYTMFLFCGQNIAVCRQYVLVWGKMLLFIFCVQAGFDNHAVKIVSCASLCQLDPINFENNGFFYVMQPVHLQNILISVALFLQEFITGFLIAVAVCFTMLSCTYCMFYGSYLRRHWSYLTLLLVIKETVSRRFSSQLYKSNSSAMFPEHCIC
jgi:hypothetical protein